MADTFVSVPHGIARMQVLVIRMGASRSPLAALRHMLKTWEERKHLRLKLQDMLLTAPHLVDDIGLTTKQVEVEIAKPFWRE